MDVFAGLRTGDAGALAAGHRARRAGNGRGACAHGARRAHDYLSTDRTGEKGYYSFLPPPFVAAHVHADTTSTITTTHGNRVSVRLFNKNLFL